MVRAGGPRSGRWRRGLVEREGAAGGQVHATAGAPPVPGECWQAGDGAHGHAAAGVALQSVVEADIAGARSTVGQREVGDRPGRHTGDRCRALHRPLRGACAELVCAGGEVRDVVVIHEVAREEHVHDAQGQRGVGAGAEPNPLVTLLGGAGADRVDADEARAVLPRGRG